MANFRTRVPMSAPTAKIQATYYGDGARCLMDYKPISGEVLSVEEESEFFLGNEKFTSIRDLTMSQDGQLVLVDHKARSLKQRSKRKKQTKADEELDKYLRQLYLYSNPIRQLYGRYPDKLVFNCYRTQELIEEPFKLDRLDEANQWALETISQIKAEDKWLPNMDYCRCKYLCDVNIDCEYCQMEYGDPRRF